jgi:rare lipoprotein A (peptidoglycan hydrolase)
MRHRRRIIQEAVLAVLAIFLIGPAVMAPAYEGTKSPASGASVGPQTQNLANPNPNLKPKPLRSWECISSWYGEDFDGQPTADGEIYDMYAQTAAHPTLPLGSIIRVEDLRTHRSAVVRINDRGPYYPGRELDVSYQVARELGFLHRGYARVKIELLEVPPSARQHPAN